MSSKEESVLCEEHVPQKLRSPPPKPPRRRHSDQSAVSLSGSYACNRKKTFNGNSSHSVKMTGTISSSGSESLPPNWTSETSQSKLKKEKPVLIKTEHNAMKTMKSYSQVPFSEASNNLEKSFLLEHDNKLANDNSVLKYSTVLDNVFTTKSNLKSANYYVNKELTDLRDLEHYLDITGALKQVRDTTVIHRRHHSDPLLSKFNKSFKTISNVKLKRAIFENTPLNSTVRGSNYGPNPTEDQPNANEITIQKEINDRLWQHLCVVQAKLDNFQRSQFCSKIDESGYPSFAELMFDVYKAQREKDIVLQNRLKAALELRDSAIQELEEVLQIVARNFENDDYSEDEYDGTNKELARFFQELETMKNPAKILQQQRILLAYLYQTKENKIQQLSSALRLAEQERDAAILKAKQLDEELCKWKSAKCVLHAGSDISECKWEGNVLDIIFEIITQRDSALAKIKSLQEQILSYNNQQSNSEYGTSQILKKVPSFRDISQQTQMPDQSSEMKAISENVTEDVELRSELSNLARQFAEEVKKRQIAEGNCQRLQRMLNFLLEKFNGLNIGIPV